MSDDLPLVLRDARPEYAAKIVEQLAAAPPRNLSFFSKPMTVERQRAYLHKMWSSESDQFFVLKRRIDGAIVGTCGLHEFDHANRNARVGMLIFPAECGKGYSRIAMRLLQRQAFRGFQLHKLYLRVFAENKEARLRYLGDGFKEEGRLREEYLLNGVWHDMIVLSLLKSEWTED